MHEHRIESAYYIGRDPVTWAQYLAFCDASRADARPWLNHSVEPFMRG